MQAMVPLLTLLSSVVAFLDSQMAVAVCNPGEVRDFIITNAEAATEVVFLAAGVRIVWAPCEDFSSSRANLMRPLFILRLRTDTSPWRAGAASLDMMGQSYLPAKGSGQLADAYYRSIQAAAFRYKTDPGTLLGSVMAHELGHLLLGRGHARVGVMRSNWSGEEARAVDKRWLRFDETEAARIRLEVNRATANRDHTPGEN